MLDIRVGEIVEVEDIKGSKKLYKLKVDIGREIREVVAGLKKYYKQNELLGKKVLLLANLKPAKIFGVLSQGMLLAADDGKTVALLTVNSEKGTKVVVK